VYHLGVDVGGTFTDTVAIDDSGNLFVDKAPTTPDAIVEGVMASLEDLARNAGQDVSGLLDFAFHNLPILGSWNF